MHSLGQMVFHGSMPVRPRSLGLPLWQRLLGWPYYGRRELLVGRLGLLGLPSAIAVLGFGLLVVLVSCFPLRFQHGPFGTKGMF